MSAQPPPPEKQYISKDKLQDEVNSIRKKG